MRLCLVVPGGATGSRPLMEAIEGVEPGAEMMGVWAGDPHLRPVVQGLRWIDGALPEPSGVGWPRLLVALPPRTYAWARAARAIERELAGSDEGLLALFVSDVAVLEGLGELVPPSGVLVAARATGRFPADGLAPSTADLASYGRYSDAVIGFGADAGELAGELADAFGECGPDTPAAAVLGAVAGGRSSQLVTTDRVHVVGWHDPDAVTAPAVLDLCHIDPDEDWHVEFADRPARLRLGDHPELAAVIRASRAQFATEAVPLRLPGGPVIDPVIRDLVREAVERWRRGEDELPPEPFGADTSQFVHWLETPWPPWGPAVGRYWSAAWRSRADLVHAFPHPEAADFERFVNWTRDRWWMEGTSPLVAPGADIVRREWDDAGRSPGINLVGYHGFDNSLGDVVRRIGRALTDAGVPHAALDYHRTGSPRLDAPPPLQTALRFDTNLVVVNADQFPLLDADHGDLLFAGRRTIGYWFWDVTYVPPSVVDALGYLDEVWVASEFTASTLRAVTAKPVRTVHVPVPEPVPSDATRTELGLPDDRFVFLVTFDHLSVTERKNPLGAIEAFRQAFPEPAHDGPVLFVKTLNASPHRWQDHERLRVAAAGRPDIIVVDRHLSRADQMALIATSDCLVSLHRAEGLGLHLLEAMWLGTPTLASRYSGNLDFMDDENSALVDVVLVPVERGEGYFPSEAVWADPDRDQAARWMRRLADDPATGERLSSAARATMEQQPSLAEFGRELGRLTAVTDSGYRSGS